MSEARNKSLLKSVKIGRVARARRLINDGLANVNSFGQFCVQ